ncbi:unknown [Methanothermobacter thermautotrophicus str. Delta H]|uniref:Uncharacterized protein n=1 Tax=Methanothermobacter thermautotrophicus (strain ATCC 29096 / DSM 1053 / JCM 10044 / NBRC 100330 / Delta H) TaxID=187420 RepID=O26308_METTH|nr:unknown [Methanothermobacter thermautotrophicus str. Delta H]
MPDCHYFTSIIHTRISKTEFKKLSDSVQINLSIVWAAPFKKIVLHRIMLEDKPGRARKAVPLPLFKWIAATVINFPGHR